MRVLNGPIARYTYAVALAFTIVATTFALASAQVLPPGGTFIDDDGNPHESNIEAIAAAGITKGCNPPINNMFCPDESVTRGQMAAFLVRALNLTDDGGGDLFIDDDDSAFASDIDKLGTAGITLGCNPPTNDMYCPSDPVRRDQMGSFLTRSLGLTPIFPPPPISTTTSSTTTTASNCDPSYPTVCIPPPPPDLNCPDIPYQDFAVPGADPHGFDGDNDGIGCES